MATWVPFELVEEQVCSLFLKSWVKRRLGIFNGRLFLYQKIPQMIERGSIAKEEESRTTLALADIHGLTVSLDQDSDKPVLNVITIWCGMEKLKVRFPDEETAEKWRDLLIKEVSKTKLREFTPNDSNNSNEGFPVSGFVVDHPARLMTAIGRCVKMGRALDRIEKYRVAWPSEFHRIAQQVEKQLRVTNRHNYYRHAVCDHVTGKHARRPRQWTEMDEDALEHEEPLGRCVKEQTKKNPKHVTNGSDDSHLAATYAVKEACEARREIDTTDDSMLETSTAESTEAASGHLSCQWQSETDLTRDGWKDVDTDDSVSPEHSLSPAVQSWATLQAQLSNPPLKFDIAVSPLHWQLLNKRKLTNPNQDLLFDVKCFLQPATGSNTTPQENSTELSVDACALSDTYSH